MLVALAAGVSVVLLALACLQTSPTSIDVGPIELVRVQHAEIWQTYDPPPAIARVFANGDFEIDGVALAADRDHEDLVAALAPIAQRMSQRDGLPDEGLFLAADRRAPFGSVADLAAACVDPRVGIWKLALLFDRADPDAAREEVGRLGYYAPLPLPSSLREFAAGVAPERRIDARADERGDARFSVGDAPCTDDDQLAERLRSSGLDVFVLRAASELPWGALAPAFEAVSRAGGVLGALATLE